MAGHLYVDFCGEQHKLADGNELTFGRQATLEIDENPYLHRVLGRFAHRDGHWWLDNVGRSIVLNLHDRNSRAHATVVPGGTTVVTHADAAVNFVAGRSRYEVDVAAEDATDPVETAEAPEAGERTLDFGVVELNVDQRLLLVDLAAHRLMNPSGADQQLRPKAESAQRLGWSLSKYNRKLDHLCAKLTKAGIAGLHGESGASAADRRSRLLEHSVAVGLVGAEDLSLLDAPV
ncbi:MAG: hypothetical protein ACR2OH_10580 [Microthrixaceae bacterium]